MKDIVLFTPRVQDDQRSQEKNGVDTVQNSLASETYEGGEVV